MQRIATAARVSVPTVELTFGTKARVLKSAIDVAIAGDDEAVAVLDRDWAGEALLAPTADEFLSIVAGILGPAQERSAGLVLALFEASPTDPELAELAAQMINQRLATATWLVDALTQRVPLRDGCTKAEAVDTVWLLMDPAVFDRLIRHRSWTPEHYQHWFGNAVGQLLIND